MARGWCVRTKRPAPLAREACRRPGRVARTRSNEVSGHPSEQRLAPLQQVVCWRLRQQRDDRAQPQASEEALVDQGRVRAAVHALLDLREAQRRYERREGHYPHATSGLRRVNSFAPCWPARRGCKAWIYTGASGVRKGACQRSHVATTLRPGDRGATFQNYSKTLTSILSRPHPHAHLP